MSRVTWLVNGRAIQLKQSGFRVYILISPPMTQIHFCSIFHLNSLSLKNLTIPSPANKVRVSFPEVSAKVSLYLTGLSQTWENANILIGQTNLGHTSPGHRMWHQLHHGQNVEEVSRTPPPEKMQYLTEMVSEYWVVKTTGEQTLHCKISPR